MLEKPEVTCPKCGAPVPFAPEEVDRAPGRGCVPCPRCGDVRIPEPRGTRQPRGATGRYTA